MSRRIYSNPSNWVNCWFYNKKNRKKLGASSKKDSICALLAWAFLFLSKSLKEIYGYYCLDIYWNWMKFVTNNKACCFVWTTHSVLTPIFELHMKDLFCCTTRIKNWQKWCWIWDFKPLRKARYTIQSHDQSSSLRVVFVWKNRLQSHNRAAAEILKGRGLIKSTNRWQRIPLMSHGNQFFPYFGVDDISSHVCIQCQTCVPIISQLDLLYTILRKPVGLFICLGDEANGG